MITVVQPRTTVTVIQPRPTLTVVSNNVNVIELASRGVQGPPGPAAPLAQALAGEDMKKGQPLYIDPGTQSARLATATVWAKAAVIGLCDVDTLAGFITQIAAVKVVLADWTLILGSASLTVGALYFLSPVAGQITLQQMTTGQTLVSIGTAVSATTLIIRPTVRILL